MVELIAATQAEAAPRRIEANIAGFGAWMVSEQRRVYLLCLRMLRSSDEADTATQDVFLKAYQALQKQGASVIEAPAKWLTRIAVNTCLDRIRSRRWLFWRQRPSQEDEATILHLTPAAGVGAEDTILGREIARRISTALDTLSIRQRAVFVLKHEEDRTLDEIGEILGLDVGTVKAHMARAVRKLREELRDLYDRQTLER